MSRNSPVTTDLLTQPSTSAIVERIQDKMLGVCSVSTPVIGRVWS